MSAQMLLEDGLSGERAKTTALLPKRMDAKAAEPVPPIFYLSPNPHLDDLLNPALPPKHVTEPCASDISAGKNTYVYDAHTYHTKVPPQGIELLIDYYTRPGDVVLDPFCGSGMTGVAAVRKGRKVILSDLSPAAAFIAYNLTTPVAKASYDEAISRVMEMTRELEHKLYDTHCRTCRKLTPMIYMVWSYGMLCSHCDQEFVLWDVVRDERPRSRDSKILKEFDCPNCGKHLEKRKLKRTTRRPVSVGYKCCVKSLKEATATPDAHDLATLDRITAEGVPEDLWYPTTEFPDGMNTKQPIAAGITSVDRAYTPRALFAMAYLWDIASRWPDAEIKDKLLFTITSLYQRVTLFSEFRFWGGSSNTANYNVPTIINEQNVFKTFHRKAKTISLYFGSASVNAESAQQVRVSAQSACHLTQLPDASVDYIFTDPPFGSNINYSEMNLLWESWLGTRTDTTEEAIVNKVQCKGVAEYEQLLKQALSEMRRVLKEDGWLTVVFHNSSADVWSALQRAITGAGFRIAGTQTFDKEHGTFKQFVADNAVGYDLVLHCRKAEGVNVEREQFREITKQRATNFISEKLHGSNGQYTVRYMHVERRDEFDYRRLYAEWLAQSLTQSLIGLSFAEFRALADECLKIRAKKVTD
jgi:adenine-specific DNA methylase